MRLIFRLIFFSVVPLGVRRRFGPAPAEDMAPPQLAQPSPSAYPRPPQQDSDSSKRGRDDSPINDVKGKLNEPDIDPRLPSVSHSNLTAALRDFQQLTTAYMSPNLLLHANALTLTIILTLTYRLFLIHSQLTQMPLAKGAVVGVMPKPTSLACQLLSLPLASLKLNLITMQFISDWKR
jgi:hypothetical protein